MVRSVVSTSKWLKPSREPLCPSETAVLKQFLLCFHFCSSQIHLKPAIPTPTRWRDYSRRLSVQGWAREGWAALTHRGARKAADAPPNPQLPQITTTLLQILGASPPWAVPADLRGVLRAIITAIVCGLCLRAALLQRSLANSTICLQEPTQSTLCFLLLLPDNHRGSAGCETGLENLQPRFSISRARKTPWNVQHSVAVRAVIGRPAAQIRHCQSRGCIPVCAWLQTRISLHSKYESWLSFSVPQNCYSWKGSSKDRVSQLPWRAGASSAPTGCSHQCEM